MAFFGRLFEKYIQDVTEKATNGDYEYIAEFSYKEKKKEKKSSYAYIRKGTNLLVVEVKGFSVLIDCMIKNEQVEKNNEKLFVKPVLQADLCLSMIIEDKTEFFGIEDAYIISVTMDNINAVPDYYNEIHKNIQKREVCEKTKYYYNFSVEEYEMLMYLLERQYDVFGILRDYYNSKALRPFSNYLQERYEDIGMTDFMEDLYDKASKRMKELAFPCG